MRETILFFVVILSRINDTTEFVQSCPKDMKNKFHNLTGTGTLVCIADKNERNDSLTLFCNGHLNFF